MRMILRLREGGHELAADAWQYLGAADAGAPQPPVPDTGPAKLEARPLVSEARPPVPQAHPLVVPQARFLADPQRWRAQAPLGVRAAPADAVEALAPHLAQLSLVAIEFPGPGDGRGYSYARLLRQRYGFKGEVRAVGPGVKQDLLFLMARCGFDSFELAPGQDTAEALNALTRYTLAYQRGVPYAPVRETRFNRP